MNASAILLPAHVLFERAKNALAARCTEAALTYLNEAESSGYDRAECAAHRWYCWMLLGNFESAWRESDLITQSRAHQHAPLWNGLPFDGNRLVIRCLHGFGDAIQFIRYAKLLRSRAASITVETPAELISLFQAQPWIDQVISWADKSSHGFSDWDQQIEVMELPHAFRTTLSSIPAGVPYIEVPHEAIRRSRHLLCKGGDKPRVGLVWQAGDWDRARSVPATDFGILATVPGVSLYSFQRGPARSGLNQLRRHAPVHDTAEHSPDIADTAADLMNMDLVITVDTMTAHLAGALGKKVWTILPFAADWRWMLGRSCSPWYPRMTLFRQPKPGDWAPVLQTIAAKLASEIGGAND